MAARLLFPGNPAGLEQRIHGLDHRHPLGSVDIEWVYNSLPPCHGRIYPEVPLKPVITF